MGSMRVVIATPLYPPEIGGPATYTRILEDGLPGMGIEVEIVKFAAVRKYPKLIRHAMYFFKLMHAGKRADAILVLDPVSTGLPAALAASFLGKPLVLKVVGDYAWEQGRQRFGITQSLDEFSRTTNVPSKVRTLRNIQSWVAGRARTVIVPSEYLKGIVATWGISAEKISVVSNAVTLTAGIVPEAVSALPRPHMLTIARLVAWKGIDGIITAVARMRAEGTTASLIIAGEGPERESLEQLAKDKLGDGYVFSGSIPSPEVHAMLADSDVFVLNSTYEGLSHVLIEALASGIPIVATDAGGNREVLAEGSGILIPVGDEDTLCAALTDALTNDATRKRLADAARRRAAVFTAPVLLERTKAILLNI
jgi:glycosyltransferase involved in cell wall biosynthesis